jgi:hypothetical protein
MEHNLSSGTDTCGALAESELCRFFGAYTREITIALGANYEQVTEVTKLQLNGLGAGCSGAHWGANLGVLGVHPVPR